MELGGLKMFVLVTYDIDQSDGGRRLHKIAKTCEKYGNRVQYSVFEMDIDMARLVKLKSELDGIMDRDLDSIRIYRIGKLNSNQVEVMGKRKMVEISLDAGIFL